MEASNRWNAVHAAIVQEVEQFASSDLPLYAVIDGVEIPLVVEKAEAVKDVHGKWSVKLTINGGECKGTADKPY